MKKPSNELEILKSHLATCNIELSTLLFEQAHGDHSDYIIRRIWVVQEEIERTEEKIKHFGV